MANAMSSRTAIRGVIFFFNDTATTEIYTLSLHDALPIWLPDGPVRADGPRGDRRQFHDPGVVLRAVLRRAALAPIAAGRPRDRKSTRLNSSHANISYAVFCLKKKTNVI